MFVGSHVGSGLMRETLQTAWKQKGLAEHAGLESSLQSAREISSCRRQQNHAGLNGRKGHPAPKAGGHARSLKAKNDSSTVLP
jgi:hypothetical protein